MKKILITGAGGFIGSHLVEKCVKEGFDVKAFVHYNSNNSHGWLDHSLYKDQCEIIAGDIRDYDSVSAVLESCDTVFHLAALIGIPYSYISPLAYVRTNVEGTYNVLQAARQLRLENVLVTSTSETYGTAQYVPIDEKHPANAQSPYAASKVAADQLALSYWRSFNMPVKIVRPFNTYGPRQSARAIIPSVITQILSGQNTIKLGNTSPTRDFTYVEDTVGGILEIAKSQKLLGEVTNIGTNSEISIDDLVGQIARIMDHEVEIEADQQRIRPPKSEVERLVCDNSKILTNTNWRPEYELKTGLIETIESIKNRLNIYKSTAYNV